MYLVVVPLAKDFFAASLRQSFFLRNTLPVERARRESAVDGEGAEGRVSDAIYETFPPSKFDNCVSKM